MAIDPNIKKKADDIRNKIYGKEVRESLASGLEAMSSDVVETVGRQDEVEGQFQTVIENTTDKDVISAPEIIAARNGEANLKARLDKENQEVTAQLAQKELQEVGLPAELLVENPINPSQKLEVFLNNSSGKKVKFPYGKTFNLERPLAIYNVENMVIDFNNCFFMLPDDYTSSVRRVGDVSIGNYVLSFFNSPDITIKNINIDGKRDFYLGNDSTQDRWQTGLHIHRCDRFKSFNFKAKELNYHAITVYEGKDVLFDRMNFFNIGLAGGTAGYSDVYTWDDNDDSSMTFLNTYSERTDSLLDNGGQIFYINSSNTIIENIVGKNIAHPYDFRKGSHYVKNVFVDECKMLVVDSYPDSVDFANVTADNVELINMIGNNTAGNSLMNIGACERVIHRNLTIKSHPTSTVLLGVNIRNNAVGASPNSVGEVIFENLKIEHKTDNARLFMARETTKSVTVKNMVLIGGENAHNAIRTQDVTGKVMIENVEIEGGFVIPFENASGSVFTIKNPPEYENVPPQKKPLYIGQEYLDIVNKKKYTSYGVSSVNDWVTSD